MYRHYMYMYMYMYLYMYIYIYGIGIPSGPLGAAASARVCFHAVGKVGLGSMPEVPFPLQLKGPRLAQSFCVLNIYVHECILVTSDHKSWLAHYAPAHCCSSHTCAYVSFSKRSQGKSTENPLDILRCPLCSRHSIKK